MNELKLRESLVDLAKQYKLKVVEISLVGHGYLLMIPDGTGEILLKKEDNLKEKNFTLGHEIAHRILNVPAMEEHWSQEIDNKCDAIAMELIRIAELMESKSLITDSVLKLIDDRKRTVG